MFLFSMLWYKLFLCEKFQKSISNVTPILISRNHDHDITEHDKKKFNFLVLLNNMFYLQEFMSAIVLVKNEENLYFYQKSNFESFNVMNTLC